MEKAKKDNTVPIDEIRALVRSGRTHRAVADLFGVSRSTVSRIAAGSTKKYRPREKTARMCACCGKRTVAKGNRMLCRECYAGNGDYQEFPVHV